MIRNVGKKVRITETVEVEKTVTQEKITAIFTRPDSKEIEVTLGLLDEGGAEIAKKFISIASQDYDLLFSDDPFFETGKSSGNYRESDLWKVIDKVSNT